MPFVPSRNPAPPGRPSRHGGPVLSVGRRVFVHCPPPGARGVPLADDAGGTAPHPLTDGDEVEILAWRPRGAGGPRYRVHAKDGREGWIAAEHLRTAARAEPTPEASGSPSAAVVEPPAGRKFGERR